MRHLLVTNDFPPKTGGIQSYLWELWRRLPPEDVTVLTTPYPGAEEFDAAAPFPIRRSRQRVLLPTSSVLAQIRTLLDETKAELVVLDPALPLGWLGPSLGVPYAVVLHGAEVTVPGRIPGGRAVLAHVVRQADRVIAAGHYPAAEAERATGRDHMPPTTIVPPGVDTDRFRPIDDDERRKARADFGLPTDDSLVVSVSRLVPRKGMDVLIDAMANHNINATLAIAGAGRDRERLERRTRGRQDAVHLLGKVPDDKLPALYGCADVFAMLCRNRWAGLEQEGFGIVFVEASAAGVPVIAGDSGGAADAVADGLTGFVVDQPRSTSAVEATLRRLLNDGEERRRMGSAGRQRAVTEFDYDRLAARLATALQHR